MRSGTSPAPTSLNCDCTTCSRCVPHRRPRPRVADFHPVLHFVDPGARCRSRAPKAMTFDPPSPAHLGGRWTGRPRFVYCRCVETAGQQVAVPTLESRGHPYLCSGQLSLRGGEGRRDSAHRSQHPLQRHWLCLSVKAGSPLSASRFYHVGVISTVLGSTWSGKPAPVSASAHTFSASDTRTPKPAANRRR